MKRAAVRRPPGGRRARHLLPRRQPGDEPGGLCRGDGAGPRRDRRRRGHGRHRRCRRRLPVLAIRAWSRRRSKPISRSSTTPSRALPISYSAELWCEPGRALCAEYASVLVRVEKRRGDRALHQRRRLWRAVRCRAYRLALPGPAGPRGRESTRATWRSASTARPATISTIWPGRSCCPPTSQAGDYIEIGMLGAYGCAMRTGFNGFGVEDRVIVDDEPMAIALRSGRAGRGVRTSSSCKHPAFPATGGDRSLARIEPGSPAFAGGRRTYWSDA